VITNYVRLVANLEKYGVATDGTVARTLAIIDAANAVANTQPLKDLQAAYGDLTPDTTAHAIIDAASLAAGSQRIREASGVVIGAANGTLRQWIGQHEDKIVKALRPAWDQAAAVVHVAGKHFPPGASPESILGAGVAAATAYQGLASALDTLAQIRSLRAEVADCAGSGEQDVTWYITGAKDLDALEAAGRAFHGSGSCWHALAFAGFTLRLNTRTEADRLAAGARSVSDAKEQAEREARAAELRDGWHWPEPAA
jgi:hypothetical protein